MPKKKELVRGGPSVPRIRQDSRLMRTHESIVDFMSGRRTSLLEALAQPFISLQFAQVLEDDLIYSDDDDYYDDDDDYHPRYAASKPLEPHPQIRQLTDEEADKIGKELVEEEDRRKEKTERNKRKKKRKKEKKRLEKESTLKENLPENNEEKSESLENEEQTGIIDDNSEENKPPESDESQTATKVGGCVELAGKDIVKINTTEDKQQNDLNLNNLNAASTKLVPEEKSNLKSKKEKKKEEKGKVTEVQQLEYKNIHVAEKPEVQMRSEPETNNEKPLGPVTEELAKRSVELASMGNRLAASGQYDMAVSCFTDAIKYNPKEFKLFGNRSLCYERLEQYESALRDADLALSMEPKWIKGLFRKGKALCGLKRYHEASLIYKDVLTLESSSVEAAQELKRAQTLHLMEMGFSWAQSTEALKAHPTLEEAVEALFARNRRTDPGGARAIWDKFNQPPHQDNNDEDKEEEEKDDDGEWTVLQAARPRTQQVKDIDCLGQIRSKSQSPTPRSRSSVKPELFSVWVGTLGPAMTYPKLHELFSRVGKVYSIKMLLELQCAFVNYTRKEDCERAIQCIDGMEVEGAPLTVRYPFKGHTGETESYQRLSTYKKECFFWRTTGCMRDDCTFRHIPEHKNIDRDKFTSRLGLPSHAGN
ncbi:stress-induced-phosphoprotein 1 isoform X2 [Gambusia affinis]|uniref:stress-induced-phosphoprotein 1 isoform X2 n=1 Tax=Gambusia affinis TaxID=33528 RepID=UPI001CDBF0F8|nr:stress-induced-phosphoprotein 1 isoform X2 [Gambusia affinis]